MRCPRWLLGSRSRIRGGPAPPQPARPTAKLFPEKEKDWTSCKLRTKISSGRAPARLSTHHLTLRFYVILRWAPTSLRMDTWVQQEREGLEFVPALSRFLHTKNISESIFFRFERVEPQEAPKTIFTNLGTRCSVSWPLTGEFIPGKALSAAELADERSRRPREVGRGLRMATDGVCTDDELGIYPQRSEISFGGGGEKLAR